MEIQRSGGQTLVFSEEGDIDPLVIPASEAIDADSLIAAIANHFNELPTTFPCYFHFTGIAEAENADTTLDNACSTLAGMIEVVVTNDPEPAEITLCVTYSEHVLNFVVGKLRFTLGPDTLISQQIGHA